MSAAQLPREALSGYWTVAMRALPIALVVVVSVVARLLTFDVVADGPQGVYLRTVAIATGSAVVVALLLAWQLNPPHVWALAGVLLTLLPGDVWHYARLWHAERAAGEVVVFAEQFADSRLDPQRWEYDLGPESRLQVVDGSVRLVTPARSFGWIEPILPVGKRRPVPRPWHAAALRDRQPDYTIQWETRFRLDGQFYILFEVLNRDGRYVLLQARPFGWHLTHPNDKGEVTATEVPDPGIGEHRWRALAATVGPSGTSLTVDGREVWRGVPFQFPKRVRFGEVRSDKLHGGEMEVRRVQVVRHYDIDSYVAQQQGIEGSRR